MKQITLSIVFIDIYISRSQNRNMNRAPGSRQPKGKDVVTIAISVPREIADWLRALAKQDVRSISSTAVLILRDVKDGTGEMSLISKLRP